LIARVLRAQAVYYFGTGAWPLVNLATFERVTGPKTDNWLVIQVGWLAVAIGLALWVGARAFRPAGAVVILAVASAAAFAAVDLHYALNGRIARIYLADAAIELLLIGALIAAWSADRKARRR
jgi:hypothetical protein